MFIKINIKQMMCFAQNRRIQKLFEALKSNVIVNRKIEEMAGR